GFPDRLPGVHSVPDDRPDRLERADVDGHDDAVARPRVAAVQADAVRSRRWLEPARRLDGIELLNAGGTDDTGIRRPGGPPRPRGAADRRRAAAWRRAGRRPPRQRAAGHHPDQREHALVPSQAARAGRYPRARRTVADLDALGLTPGVC